jgi:hypothetical protein
MAWVPEDDFDRILEMGKEIERRKAKGAKSRVLQRRESVDYWFTILCSIACVIIILLALLRLGHEL